MCLFRSKMRQFTPSQEYSNWLSNQKTIKDVHRFFDSCKYEYDHIQFKVDDYWQDPDSFFHSRLGDCEDWHWWLADAIYRALGWESYLLIGWKWEKFPKATAHGMTIFNDGNGYKLINYWDVIPMQHLRDKEALKRAGYTYFGGIFQMPNGKKA